jgi:hypothetical protein
MHLYVAVARRWIGALQQDEQGRALQRQADEWMAAQHIKNPACMTRMLAPGFRDSQGLCLERHEISSQVEREGFSRA